MTTYTLGFVHSVAFPVHTDLWDKQSTLVCHRRKSMTDVCSCLPLTMCKILFSVCNTLFQFSLFFLPKFFFLLLHSAHAKIRSTMVCLVPSKVLVELCQLWRHYFLSDGMRYNLQRHRMQSGCYVVVTYYNSSISSHNEKN